MLSLNQTNIATEDDIDNNLVYWASIFKATTWEEFKALAAGNPAMEEVGDLILELNTDNQTKELLEGQRRYREMMASQYTAGYTDAEDNYKSIIADKDATIANMGVTIADKDAEIAELKKALNDIKRQSK
ncbi:hypothetical protein [Butyrivibrio sp. LC3010]|uniref:hypothetical protein n=1 Tax=Butyrivibrio sp. LC3010 TaxID=1280680 RepID=UPI000479B8BF|nr:hypothetical protein [Butyrivibrio sp. LC3010]